MFVVGIDCHCHHRHRHHSPIIGSLGNDGNEKKMMAMKKKMTGTMSIKKLILNFTYPKIIYFITFKAITKINLGHTG